MLRSRMKIVCALGAGLVLAGSAGSLAAGTTTTVATGKQDGKTVSVRAGGALEIRLKGCYGSCGYRWLTTHKPDPKVLRQLSSRIVAAQVTGRPEVQVIRYRAVAKGTTSLKLGYTGPGRGRKPEDSYTLTVRVSRASN